VPRRETDGVGGVVTRYGGLHALRASFAGRCRRVIMALVFVSILVIAWLAVKVPNDTLCYQLFIVVYCIIAVNHQNRHAIPSIDRKDIENHPCRTPMHAHIDNFAILSCTEPQRRACRKPCEPEPCETAGKQNGGFVQSSSL
jgi:hypothetical protein